MLVQDNSYVDDHSDAMAILSMKWKQADHSHLAGSQGGSSIDTMPGVEYPGLRQLYRFM